MMNFADIITSLPFETLEETLRKDSNLVNIRGYGGYTALHKGVLVGNQPLVRMLLQSGADPNSITNSGDTCLHIACCRGSLQLVNILLEYRGDFTIKNYNGYLPIHCAAQNGSIAVVQFLTEVYHCKIDVTDGNGATILHAAAAGGHVDLVNYLVKRLSLNCIDNFGNTPLHSAACGGVSGVCWVIVNNGGEFLLLKRNKNGQTPQHVAEISLSVSLDCKKWLKRWSEEFTQRGSISSPLMDWLIMLFTPFFIFHIAIFLDMLAFPHREGVLSLFGLLTVIFILRTQNIRLKHPSRWSNPIYLGAYSAGLVSTLFALFLGIRIHFHEINFLWSIFALINTCILLYLFYKLLTSDAGIVPPTECLKGTLKKLAGETLTGRYCPQCRRWAPSLSHHCRLCNKCFLVLDHHCLFLNKCIAEGNHWYFVMFVISNAITMFSFIATSFMVGPVHWENTAFIDIVKVNFQLWFSGEIWIGLLVLLNFASMLWAFYLLNYQFKVISRQQTTYCHLKSASPARIYSFQQRLLNFINFLYKGRLPLSHANLYFEQV